jgi:hypothetical protein
MAAPATDLIFVRLVTAKFGPPPSGSFEWTIVDGNIEVRPLQTYGVNGGLKALISAAIPLRYFPKVTAPGEVVVPRRERADCERAAERAINLVSVGHGCSRQIASPWPSSVFVATSDAARQWLADRKGLHHAKLKMAAVRTRDRVELDPDALNQLSDRDDGVALMAEALGTGHATARFHEFVRLFERAFAKSSSKLVEPLRAFLSPRLGYTEAELTRWFGELRDPATHADVRSRIVLEVDIRPVVDRMEQAAYDVLLNKKTWRDASIDRRDVWAPDSGTTNAAGDAFIVQHTTPITQGSFWTNTGFSPWTWPPWSARARLSGGRKTTCVSQALRAFASKSSRQTIRTRSRERSMAHLCTQGVLGPLVKPRRHRPSGLEGGLVIDGPSRVPAEL